MFGLVTSRHERTDIPMRPIEVIAPSVANPVEFGSPTAQAIRVGDLLFISGMIAWDVRRRTVGVGDITVQTRQALRNMEDVLVNQGGSLRDVVKITFFLTDIRDKEAVWAVRKEMFGDHRPASTLVAVSQLVDPNAKLEVEAVAFLAPAPGRGSEAR